MKSAPNIVAVTKCGRRPVTRDASHLSNCTQTEERVTRVEVSSDSTFKLVATYIYIIAIIKQEKQAEF